MNRYLLSAASVAVAAVLATSASANTLYFQMNPNELSGPRQAFIFGAPNLTGSVIGSSGFNQSFDLGAQGFAVIDVPQADQLSSGTIQDRGYRIESSGTVSGYYLSRAPATTDMTYLIDGSRLGTEYMVAGYQNIRPDQMSVQATADNTTVTFTPKGGVAFDVVLNAGQTYMYTASTQLTGSTIVGDKPIAVFSGNQCSNVPTGAGACDHIVEQMPSVDQLSTNYLLAQTVRTANGNIVRVVATADATEVKFNGTTVATLNKGEFYEGRVVGGVQLDANNKVLVAQYLTGTDDANAVTDPAMTIVPGSDQWLKSYVFASPSGEADFPADYISVVMQTSDIGSLTIDGVLADAAAFNPLAASTYSFANFDVSDKSGPFTIAAANPFQLLLMGFDSYDSYFTFGGAAFSPGASGGGSGLYWDGSAEANGNNGVVDGGDGTWNLTTPTFTDSSGAANGNYPETPATVIFAGEAGTVTVDNVDGQVQATGLTFLTDGYVITGGPLELVAASMDGGDGDGEGDGGDGDGELMLLSLDIGTAAITTATDVTATIEADLFGDVNVEKLGLGTLVLSGDNTFLDMRISQGTLALAANNSGGDGVITIANDATLAAGANGVVVPNDIITEGNGLVDAGPATWTFTLNGDISGEGSISQIGAGNLVLNGDNSFVNLGINQGTVTLGSDTAGGSANIAINNNATLAAGKTGLVVDNAVQTTGSAFINSGTGVFTLTGPITDQGSITKVGSGTLILTGASTYAGETFVNVGTLRVNGSTTSATTVASGATLGGTGAVGSVKVLSGGIVAPGNSIGTLNVSGAYAQAAGGIYAAEVSSVNGLADRIGVSGTATLAPGAILNVVKADAIPFALGSRYRVLSAGLGLTGTFTLTGATRVSQFIDVFATYDANNAYLNVAQTRSFVSAADTPNQEAAAFGVDRVGNGAVYQAIAYQPDAASAQYAFDQVSGEIHASLLGATFEDSRFVREAIYNHTADKFLPGMGLWVAGFGSWGAAQDDGNAARLDRTIAGFFLGFDALKTDVASVGVLTGYSTADINVPNRNSYASTDDLYVGLYGNYDIAGFTLSGAVTNTWRWVGTRRAMAFEGFQESVQADYLINTFQVFGEAGYQFNFGGFGVKPFASFAYVNVDGDGFTEKYGSASLTADDSGGSDYWTTLLGLKASYGLPIAGNNFAITASGGWRYVFEGETVPERTMHFQAGPDFTVFGAPIAQNAFAASFSVQTKLTDRADFDIGYSGQYGDGWNDSGVRAALRLRF